MSDAPRLQAGPDLRKSVETSVWSALGPFVPATGSGKIAVHVADALLAPSGPLAPLLARIGELEAALAETKGALKQGLGIIVEFGDMNGFRNTTDEELGRLVKTVAEDIGHLLNKLEGRPYRARSVLDQETRHAG
jgi:hypothetical protein